MSKAQMFALCTLSAVIGFGAGQLSPSPASQRSLDLRPHAPRSPNSPNSRESPLLPPRPAESPREASPRPLETSGAPPGQPKARPKDPEPASTSPGTPPKPPRSTLVHAVGPEKPLGIAGAEATPAKPTFSRAALLSSFRFAGVGPHGGVRLGRVARGSLPELLGLKTGDEIITLNGLRIAEPQQALQAYARLPYVDDWVAGIHRDGAPTEVRYALR